MNLSIRTLGEASAIEVSDAVFAVEYNEALIHQVVTAYLAGGRAGTHAQKNRAAVSGGGKKPWRQKGTGRARAGTTRGPLWRKGGVTFAAVPANYEQKVNRKMYRGAIRSILSELIRLERLIVVDTFDVNSPKTKTLLQQLVQYELKEVLIVVDHLTQNLLLAARNLPRVRVATAASLDPVSLVAYEHVLITHAALKAIEESLS